MDKIIIPVNNWASAQLVSISINIILKEILGFETELDFVGSTDSVYACVGEGVHTFNLETWVNSKQDQREEWVVDDEEETHNPKKKPTQKVVKETPVGYYGREGLFLSDSLAASHSLATDCLKPFLQNWQAYTFPQVLNLLPPDKSTQSQDLQEYNPVLHALLRKMTFSHDAIEETLQQLKGGDGTLSIDDAACKWVKENFRQWQHWVPMEEKIKYVFLAGVGLLCWHRQSQRQRMELKKVKHELEELDQHIRDGSLRRAWAARIAGIGSDYKASVAMLDNFIKSTKRSELAHGSSLEQTHVRRRISTVSSAVQIADNWLQRVQQLEDGAVLHKNLSAFRVQKQLSRRSSDAKKQSDEETETMMSELCIVCGGNERYEPSWDGARKFLEDDGIAFSVLAGHGSYEATVANVLCYVLSSSAETSLETPAAAVMMEALRHICEGRQVVLVGLSAVPKQHTKLHELRNQLRKAAVEHGAPMYDSITNAVKELCQGSLHAINNPGKAFVRKARQDFATKTLAFSTIRLWEEKQITGQEAKERTEGSTAGPVSKQSMKQVVPSTDSSQKLIGMCIPPIKLVQPIFTHFVESREKPRPARIFYEDDKMMLFPNVKGHQRSVDGTAAAMSYVHMLCIPKERVSGVDPSALQTKEVQEYYLKERDFDLSPDALDPQYLECYVHMHPNHSVGHLHVHCCLSNLWTANGDKLMHKNTRLDDVISVLTDGQE
eukprot:g1465.t1